MMRGKNVFEPPRFMSTQQAANQLVQVVRNKKSLSNGTNQNGDVKTAKDCDKHILNETSLCIAAARIGSEDQRLAACTLEQLLDVDMGPPLHSLIIPSTLHHIEQDFINTYALNL